MFSNHLLTSSSCFFLFSPLEISKVRINLFHMSAGKDPLVLPDEQGAQPAVLTEKVYVPTKDYPDVSDLLVVKNIFLRAWFRGQISNRI